MKRNVLTWSLAVFVVIGLIGISRSANTCAPTDQACYVIGSSQNPTTVFRIDAAGNTTTNSNMTVVGTATHTGITVYTPSSVTVVSSASVVSPTATYMQVISSGTGNVTCGLSVTVPASQAAAPCISTSTAVNGQFIIVFATTTVATVTFSSATTAGMDLGAAGRAVQFGRSLGLIYDSSISEWKELFYGNN